jgi:hypothetical protein
VKHFSSRAGKAGRLHIRRVDMKRYGEELNLLIDTFNDAWSENWKFIPFTKAEAAHLSKGLRPLINAELFWIAELDGKPICMALCLQNLCEAAAGLNGKLLPFGWARMLWRLKVAGVKTARVPLMGDGMVASRHVHTPARMTFRQTGKHTLRIRRHSRFRDTCT